jgi:hypothetical protein
VGAGHRSDAWAALARAGSGIIEATLQFEKAGTVKVVFPIAAIGASAPGAAAGGGSMMHGGSMMQMKGHH